MSCQAIAAAVAAADGWKPGDERLITVADATANSSNGPGESGCDTHTGRRAFPQGNSAGGGTLLCRAADAP